MTSRRGTDRWQRRYGRVAAGVLALLLAAGCGSADLVDSAPQVSQPSGSTVIRAATLRAGQPVPLPAGKPVLTLVGRVSAVNRARTVVVDRATLERMGVVQVRVYEPWIKQELEFRGVWLKDLLGVAGAAADFTGIRITALDDYQVDLTAGDVRAGGILLAVGAGDGSDIPIAKGGPTRIIFVGGVAAGANADQWIWSIRTIEIR